METEQAKEEKPESMRFKFHFNVTDMIFNEQQQQQQHKIKWIEIRTKEEEK